jgi:type I restriction enzyme R subunit
VVPRGGHLEAARRPQRLCAQTLIDDFSKKNSVPHIAISVDMLDTGIDVPEVVNLVFFKQVRSKTKFWQMMGRGTRLCPDLFGPGQDKEYFRVFDFCQNLEFFGANPELKEASAAKSLSERLFAARLDLMRALDSNKEKTKGLGETKLSFKAEGVPATDEEVRGDAAKVLQETVSGMNLDNFIVRRRRRAVEKYRAPEAWVEIDDAKREELVEEIAALPSAHALGTEDAKRFDLLMFLLQLALLNGSKRFDALRKELLAIAAALEAQTAIPAIAHQAALIEEIQTDQWWEGITVPLLELVRLRLRDLVQHIDKSRKAIVYSNFADEIGAGEERDLPQVGEADFARFKLKARNFLKANESHIVIHKLRQGRPLTPTDLVELEKMLLDAGVGEAGDIERAREGSQGFGRFVRSLVGLERSAVTEAFGEFLASGTATAAQIQFVNMVIEHLTHQGTMEPGLLYEPPFTDVSPTGPEKVFDEDRVARLFARIQQFNESAVA